MDTIELFGSTLLAGQRLSHAEVEAVFHDQSSVLVRFPDGDGGAVLCDVLHTSQAPLTLHSRDRVLVWRPASDDQRAVIIGRLGPASRSDPLVTPAGDVDDDIPDELVLEARKTLTLRVGDGSITIGADGKVLIKGKDLVSHAQRINRIKGGSVAIN